MSNQNEINAAINNNNARELALALASAGVSARWNAAGEYVEIDGRGFVSTTGDAWAVEGYTLGTLEVFDSDELADELAYVVKSAQAIA